MNSRFLNILFSLIICFTMVLTPQQSVTARTSSAKLDINTVITNGLSFIQTQQNEDGGIRWTEETSNPTTTLHVVLALAAVGYPQDYIQSSSGKTPIEYLLENAQDWIYQTESADSFLNVARTGQVLTATAAANQDPRALGSNAFDLITAINNTYNSSQGSYGNATPDNVLDQVWAIIGLAAAHAHIPPEAVDWLTDVQQNDGSWNDGWGSYLDTTPLAMIALLASNQRDATSPEIQLAINFMMGSQSPSGGWQSEWDTTTNANTTGMMLQAIAALGQLPMDDNWQTVEGNPMSALLALQKEDGSIGGDFTNAYSTASALIGLSGSPLYFLGHLTRVGKAFEYIFKHQLPNGGWSSPGLTIDVILALQAAGWDPDSVTQNQVRPFNYLAETFESYTDNTPDSIGKLILAAVAAGKNPQNFEQVNLVEKLLVTFNQDTNAFGDAENTWHQAFGILGLAAAEEAIPESVIQTLLDLQFENGGWEYSPGYGTLPDNTALAIQALTAAGIPLNHPAIENGLAFLKASQLENGGWGDSSTTAFVLLALNALNLSVDDFKTENGFSPLDNLFSFQKSNGAFVYNWEFPEDNILSTATALLAALSGDYLIAPLKDADKNHAGLMIDLGDNTREFACVQFSEEVISGLTLLEKSGFTFDEENGFINSILETSNPQGETMYWSYWFWDGRQWQAYQTGAGAAEIRNGAINAWAFVDWEVFPSPPPAFTPNLNEICGRRILVDYQAQPYLSHRNLQGSKELDNPNSPPYAISSEASPTTPEPEWTATSQNSTETAQTDIQHNSQEPVEQPEDSLLPLWIILGAAGVLTAILYGVLRKKS